MESALDGVAAARLTGWGLRNGAEIFGGMCGIAGGFGWNDVKWVEWNRENRGLEEEGRKPRNTEIENGVELGECGCIDNGG